MPLPFTTARRGGADGAQRGPGGGGAALLARRLGTEAGPAGALAGSMTVVRLPLVGVASAARALDLRERLLAVRCDAPLHALEGAIWLRLSAQAYNEAADYERLADTLAEVLREERWPGPRRS